MVNHFIGTKKQMNVKSNIDNAMRIFMLPITLPLFILRWIAYNYEQVMFGLDKYLYEPLVDKISTWVARKFWLHSLSEKGLTVGEVTNQ